MWLPNQLASRPTFDTPTNPPVALFHTLPETTALTGVGELVLTFMSKSSASFHIGTRKTVWRPWPKYSWVICSSIASLVFFSAPNSGDAGSRTWKSIGPCLIWMMTLSSKRPSRPMKLS